jgi:hypothetical protein
MASKWREAEEMIREFKQRFTQEFDAWVDVQYDFKRTPDLPKISITELLDVVNEVVEEEFNGGLQLPGRIVPLTEGVLTRTRGFELIIYRHLLFYIANKLGYRLTQIEKSLPICFDHTTILHGKKKMEAALEIKDKYVIRAYNKVSQRIHDKYSINVSNEGEERDTERSTGDTTEA